MAHQSEQRAAAQSDANNECSAAPLPRLSEKPIDAKYEGLRAYLPENVSTGVLQVLEDGPSALIEFLASPEHSPSSTALHVRVVNNLVITFQLFLFFAEFIKMLSKSPNDILQIQQPILLTAALDILKKELALLFPSAPLAAVSASSILAMMDHYTHFFIIRSEELIMQTVHYGPRVTLLGDLFVAWRMFRVTQFCEANMSPHWNILKDLASIRLASRILQWRDLLQRNDQALFRAKITIPCLVDPGVTEENADPILTKLAEDRDPNTGHTSVVAQRHTV